VVHKQIVDENFVEVRIGNRTIKALVDSGSSASIISADLLKQLQLQGQQLKSNQSTVLFSASNNMLRVIGTAEICLSISGQTHCLFISHEFKVVQNVSHNIILGMDFLRQNKVILDCERGVMTVDDDLLQVPLTNTKDDQSQVYTVSSICLPANSETLVEVKCPSQFNNKTVLIEAKPELQFKDFAVARSFNLVENGKVWVKVLNFKPMAKVIKRGQPVALIKPLGTVVSCSPFQETDELERDYSQQILQSPEVLEKFVADYKIKINPNLTQQQRRQMLQLLYDYRDVFARNLLEMKRYQNYQLDLETVTNRKYYRRQYKLSEVDEQEVERQIQEMLQADVIQPAKDCYYNSPVFLVQKKDGTKRLVQDLRGINELIVPKTVQLPRITELLDNVMQKSPKYWNSFDMKSGYWQVPLGSGSRSLTAFTSPKTGNRYVYNVTPFGLSCSPYAMLHILSHVFGPKTKVAKVGMYMDDLVCVGSTWEENLKNVKIVLQTLRDNSLSANPSKTEVAMEEIEYLGFRVSQQGVKVSERKLKIIKELPPPKNRKGVSRLLGLIQFFKRFIDKYPQNTYHMRQLLKKDAIFNWTPECDRELQYIKSVLTSDSVLQPVDINQDVYIFTDACERGFSFCTMQRDGQGILRPIAFGGQALTKAQKSYLPVDLELTAAALAIKNYDYWLVHRKIYLATDNVGVLHLKKWKPVNQRQKRLISYLQQFDITIKYIKGQNNMAADCLSRVFDDMSEETRLQFSPQVDEGEDFLIAIHGAQDENNIRPTSASEGMRSEENGQQQVTASACSGIGDMNRAVAAAPNLDNIPYLQTAPPVVTTAAVTRAQRNNLAKKETVSPPTDVSEESAAQGQLSAQTMSDSEPLAEVTNDTPVIAQGPTDDVADVTEGDDLVELTQISSQDYIGDQEFEPIYTYLTTGELTGDDKLNKKILLTADQYFLAGELMYKISLPRSRKQQRIRPLTERLCVPKVFRFDLLNHLHNFGHFGQDKLFLSLQSKYYWYSLFSDVKEFVASCDVCMKAKRHFAARTAPLNPLDIPNMVFEVVQTDHKSLSRKTPSGKTAILVFVDAFSGWVCLEAVENVSALVTAQALIKRVVSQFGIPKIIISDSGSAFTAQIFQHIAKTLNIKHKFSAVAAPRSNARAERTIRDVAQLIKVYCTDDSDIENNLPLIEMAINNAEHTGLKVSPFEIVMGRKMPICEPGMIEDRSMFTSNQREYYEMLVERLRELHKAVSENRQELKDEMKNRYDKENKAREQAYQVGQKVWLQSHRIKPRSECVLAHNNYVGPFFITDIIANDNIGPAYRLVECETGRTLRRLINVDRLKPYKAERMVMEARLSSRIPKSTRAEQSAPLDKSEQADSQQKSTHQTTPKKAISGKKQQQQTQRRAESTQQIHSGYYPALKILKERVRSGITEYLVRFVDLSHSWTSQVTPALLRLYRLQKEKSKDRRRKKRQQMRRQVRSQ